MWDETTTRGPPAKCEPRRTDKAAREERVRREGTEQLDDAVETPMKRVQAALRILKLCSSC